jgi:hypothetical protein
MLVGMYAKLRCKKLRFYTHDALHISVLRHLKEKIILPLQNKKIWYWILA